MNKRGGIATWATGVALLVLAGCGFTPVHGQGAAMTAARAGLSAIEIAPIGARLGVVMRNDLLDRISPFGGPGQARYRLEVDLDTTTEGLGFRRDEAITRTNLTLAAHYRLVDVATGDVVFDDVTRSVVGYNVVQSDFANLNAARDAEQRAARIAGEAMVERLVIFLARRQASGTE